jgi:hypothetical protein
MIDDHIAHQHSRLHTSTVRVYFTSIEASIKLQVRFQCFLNFGGCSRAHSKPIPNNDLRAPVSLHAPWAMATAAAYPQKLMPKYCSSAASRSSSDASSRCSVTSKGPSADGCSYTCFYGRTSGLLTILLVPKPVREARVLATARALLGAVRSLNPADHLQCGVVQRHSARAREDAGHGVLCFHGAWSHGSKQAGAPLQAAGSASRGWDTVPVIAASLARLCEEHVWVCRCVEVGHPVALVRQVERASKM